MDYDHSVLSIETGLLLVVILGIGLVLEETSRNKKATDRFFKLGLFTSMVEFFYVNGLLIFAGFAALFEDTYNTKMTSTFYKIHAGVLTAAVVCLDAVLINQFDVSCKKFTGMIEGLPETKKVVETRAMLSRKFLICMVQCGISAGVCIVAYFIAVLDVIEVVTKHFLAGFAFSILPLLGAFVVRLANDGDIVIGVVTATEEANGGLTEVVEAQ